MRTAVAAVLLSALLVVALWRATETTAADRRADRFERERDSVLAIIDEHKDSAVVHAERATTRERIVTRYVERIDTLRERVEIFVEREDWKRAYEARTVEADTLRVALSISRQATDDALRASAYWQLAYLADSTRLHEAEIVVSDLRHARRAKFLHRLGVTVGYGATASGGQVYAGPTVSASVRVWP